ncbi:hypothetical protein ACL9RF_17485 [Sphingobacterium sp. Mn56C]|uniref:hypothetical protein n=1 Tax=Sphingobacterium sp. Mn56C TaxID=3395261 RepID=UPI003BC4CB2B
MKDREISLLVEEVNEFCLNASIKGFHYTRAIPEQILKLGLTCRTGEEIRFNFIKDYGHLFSKTELQIIRDKWASQFDQRQQQSRDNYIFFNFTTSALYNVGAEPLLLNFGGEQIYMPFYECDNISSILKDLGSPMILKCNLDPGFLNTFSEYPWGKIAVSSYHTMCNPEACRVDQDGYKSVDVHSNQIEILLYDSIKDFSRI